jgi:hypothetical protein
MNKLHLPESDYEQFLTEEYITEMALIGQFMQKKGDSEGKTGFKVYVTNDSRPLSHIHIVGRKGINKRVCVQFSNPPKYFKHDSYTDEFSLDEAEEFDKFLKQPYKYAQIFKMGKLKFDVKTYWEYCVYQWKLENDGSVDNMHLETDKNGFVIFPKQPNYNELV